MFVTTVAAAVAACAVLAATVIARPTGRPAEQLAAAQGSGPGVGGPVGGPVAVMAGATESSSGGPAAQEPCPDTTSLCERTRALPGRRTVAVVGDSVARSLDPGLTDLAGRNGWGYVLAAHNGCGLTGMVTVAADTGRPKPFMQECAEETPGRIGSSSPSTGRDW